MNKISRLIQAADQGDAKAARDLLPAVYQELRQLAERRLANDRAGQTLNATDLVHEAYQRIAEKPDKDAEWNGTGHFFGAAAEAMRRILIDRARSKAAIKRGGDRQRIRLDGFDVPDPDQSKKLIELDDALGEFERQHPHKAKLVKLRFFAGLTNSQAAAAMSISPATAERYWVYARAWLKTEME